MAPALLRFYGGSAAEWQATPWAQALPFYQAIPRLRAQEAGMPDAGIAGFDFEKLLKDLEIPAVQPAPKAAAARSSEELKAVMSRMGVKVDIQ